MAEASSSSSPPKPDDNPPSSFRVKTITYGHKVVTVCMQNENGPCPLLAICNVLLLRGDMYIHPDLAFITLEELTSQLTTCILKSAPAEFASDGERHNYEANVAASINDIPSLATGLDVNVRFSGVFGFEFTSQLAIFDLVRVPLCHGWLPDPASSESEIIRVSSYNQLVERVINSQVAIENMSAKASSAPSNEASSSAASSSAPTASSSTDVSPPTSEEAVTEITHGQIIGKWLDDNASQLTFYGITKLYEELKEGQTAVLFRNNHFSTILMKEASLWVLLTDQGFAKQAAVWEKLESVDGSSCFVTSEFTPFSGTADDYVALPDVSALQIDPTNASGYVDPQVDLDAQLAAQLQDAEDRKAEKQQRLTQSDKGKNAPHQGAKSAGKASAAKRPLNQSTPPRGARAQPAQPAPRKRANSDGKKKKDEDCCIL